MKYRLNKLPVKTTNGFKINDLELEFDIPKISSFHDFQIRGEDLSKIQITTSIQEKRISSKIGLTFDKYYSMDIVVPKGVSLTSPIFLTYSFSGEDVLIDQISISYEEGSKADFIIQYVSKDEGYHFHHLKEMVSSAKDSSGSISVLNFLNTKSYHFLAMETNLSFDSHIEQNVIDLGGKVRLYNAYADLFEKESQMDISMIYIGKESQVIDMNYYMKNVGAQSVSRMMVEGAIGDFCHKKFRGCIDFVSGCQEAIGEEKENCVLLSDTCQSKSLPQLLCGEENVVGSHGVSSGKVPTDRLFYLMSRGYSKEEAEKLIINGNFSQIIRGIPDEMVQDRVRQRIDELLFL